jgi:hypothetical protein
LSKLQKRIDIAEEEVGVQEPKMITKRTKRIDQSLEILRCLKEENMT